MYYLLDEKKQPYKVSLDEMIKSYNNPEISNVKIDELDNGVNIRTKFTFHENGSYEGKPLLFETYITGGEHNGYCEKYFTYDEAVIGHDRCLKMINK